MRGRHRPDRDRHLCFNPRPAVRPGDAAGIAHGHTADSLFQSAPGREAGRCRRVQIQSPGGTAVSIRARP